MPEIIEVLCWLPYMPRTPTTTQNKFIYLLMN